MRLAGRRLTERGASWFLLNRKDPIDISAQVEAFTAGVTEVCAQLPKLLRGGDAQQLAAATAELVATGVPQALAARCAAASTAYSALDIVEVAWDSGRAPVEVAECYFDLVDRLGIGALRDRITALPRTDRWETMARAAVREDLYSAQAALTFDVLAAAPGESEPEARFDAWVHKNQAGVERARSILSEISSADSFDLAILSVALRVIRTLLRTNAM
jgi:glutamate dehydrogenase